MTDHKGDGVLLALQGPEAAARLEALKASGGRHVGTFFRRTRREDGQSVQRAEARFDGLAGCLRTPRGGSSRQSVIVIEDGVVNSNQGTGPGKKKNKNGLNIFRT